MNEPAGQRTGEGAPATQYAPAGQGEHAEGEKEPGVGLYVPAGQATGAVAAMGQ